MNLRFWRRQQPHKAQQSSLTFWPKVESEATYTSSRGEPRANGAVVACVQKIVSRAAEIPFEAKRADTRNILKNPSWLHSVDTRMMWERIYEQVLYEGHGAIVRTAGGKLRVGYESGKPDVITMEGQSSVRRDFRTMEIGDCTEETIRVQDMDICRIHWAESRRRPWDIIRCDAFGYKETADDLYQESKFARRVTSEFDVSEVFQDGDEIDEKLEGLRNSIPAGRKFFTLVQQRGINFRPQEPAKSPPYEERSRVSLAGVARVYGVPIQLLNAGVDRQTIDEADAHLLRDAVLPLARKVASGLSKLFRDDVQVDMRAVGLPSRTGMGGLLMQLSQSGVLTINEIREQVGFEKIAGGDKFPETAGVAERGADNGSEKKNDSKNKA